MKGMIARHATQSAGSPSAHDRALADPLLRQPGQSLEQPQPL